MDGIPVPQNYSDFASKCSSWLQNLMLMPGMRDNGILVHLLDGTGMQGNPGGEDFSQEFACPTDEGSDIVRGNSYIVCESCTCGLGASIGVDKDKDSARGSVNVHIYSQGKCIIGGRMHLELCKVITTILCDFGICDDSAIENFDINTGVVNISTLNSFRWHFILGVEFDEEPAVVEGPKLPLKSVEKKLRKLMLNMTSRRSDLTAPERGRRKNTVLRAAPVETITSLVSSLIEIVGGMSEQNRQQIQRMSNADSENDLYVCCYTPPHIVTRGML